MLFLVVAPPSHLQLKCDGGCRRTLREGTWIYRCDTCQLDLCAACSPEGVLPVAAPPPPRVKAKRNRGQRASAPDQPAKRRAGPACRGKRDPRAPTLFDSDSDEAPADSGGDAPGAARGHQPGAGREGDRRGRHHYVSSVEAKDRRSHGRVVPRVSLTGKGPGASVAEYPLYVRAGKDRERERDPLKGPLRHPLDTPAPPRFWSFLCSCGWVWRVCVCAPHLAPSTLCLHGTCGRASCRDGNLT